MNSSIDTARTLARPTQTEATGAVALARRRFQRVLAAWACDALELRRLGIAEAAWSDGGRATAQAA